MKKKIKELQRKVKRTLLLIVATLLAASLAAFAFIHRRVILAAIKGEPLPEMPANHPCGKLLHRKGK